MNKDQIISALLEIKRDCLSIHDDASHKAVMDKYNMIITGTRRNVISTSHFIIALKNYFQIDITDEELLSVIPEMCAELDMHIEPFTDANTSDRDITAYEITLT